MEMHKDHAKKGREKDIPRDRVPVTTRCREIKGRQNNLEKTCTLICANASKNHGRQSKLHTFNEIGAGIYSMSLWQSMCVCCATRAYTAEIHKRLHR